MQNYNLYSDQKLISLLEGGDRFAFAEIYERFWALLLHHAIKMLRDEVAAQDIVQDIFQMLWEKKAELNVHTSLSSFLYTSVRYKILNQLKHSKIESHYLSTLQTEIESAVSSTNDAMIEKEFAERIQNSLSQLPPKMRKVFELSRFQQYTYRQIAEELNLADNTVKRQISNALKIMRTGLDKYLFLFF